MDLPPYVDTFKTGHTGKEIKIDDYTNQSRLPFLEDFCKTLALRYEKAGISIDSIESKTLYYRVVHDDTSPYIEIKDEFSIQDIQNFRDYSLTQIGTKKDRHRIPLDKEKLNSIGLYPGTPVVFVGNGDHIEIYSKEVYDRMPKQK